MKNKIIIAGLVAVAFVGGISVSSVTVFTRASAHTNEQSSVCDTLDTRPKRLEQIPPSIEYAHSIGCDDLRVTYVPPIPPSTTDRWRIVAQPTP